MHILLPFHNTGFYFLQEDEKEEIDKSGEEILCAILYLENSDKARFSNFKKRVENDYVLNKAEYPSMVTANQIILLNYQPNYSYNRKSQSKGVRNQLMFAQHGKTGEYEVNRK